VEQSGFFWHIEDALKYLFNIQNPDTTVKDVTESARREAVGQSDLQPMLSAERQKTEQQDVFDRYGAGVRVDRCGC
jgi:membrane protease subunit HflK